MVSHLIKMHGKTRAQAKELVNSENELNDTKDNVEPEECETEDSASENDNSTLSETENGDQVILDEFQCPYCPKVFKTETGLAGHQKIQHFPCPCPICKEHKRIGCTYCETQIVQFLTSKYGKFPF